VLCLYVPFACPLQLFLLLLPYFIILLTTTTYYYRLPQLPPRSSLMPMGFTSLPLQPQQFSYELLNSRYQRDQHELQTMLRLSGAAPLDFGVSRAAGG